VIGGLAFLFREILIGVYPVEIDLPKLQMKLKVPSGLAAIIIGGALLAYPLWKAHETPPKHPVSGKIQLHKGKQVFTPSGIMVGVLPSSHIAYTRSDGGYSLAIPKGDNAYQTVVYFQSKNLFDLGIVTFKPNGEGNFDYTFDEGSVKK
jgi:hypothetical protein